VRTSNPVKLHRARCRGARAHMSDYLDGELCVPRAAAGVERHVRWCPDCRRILETLRHTVAGLGALRDVPTPAGEPRG
jgi:predicted anti-sigma-YlaC factor YlaD